MDKLKLRLDKKLLTNVPFANWIYASFAVNIFVILFVVAVQRWLPPQVPLFYGTAEGEGQLAGSLSLAIPNILAMAITLANTFLSFTAKDPFIKKTLIVAGLAATFLATITVIKIIFLVGSF